MLKKFSPKNFEPKTHGCQSDDLDTEPPVKLGKRGLLEDSTSFLFTSFYVIRNQVMLARRFLLVMNFFSSSGILSLCIPCFIYKESFRLLVYAKPLSNYKILPGQINDQLVDLPIEHQIYDMIDAEGSKGLKITEVCSLLSLL